MLVKNLNGIPRDAGAGNDWLAHWEKFSGQTAYQCFVKGCTNRLSVGGHVQKDSATDTSWYVVPLCDDCNRKEGRDLEIWDMATLVPLADCDAAVTDQDAGNVPCTLCGGTQTRSGHFLSEVCDTCLNDLLTRHDERISARMETLETPAVLVGRDLKVLFHNRHFHRMFGTFHQQILGLRIGEALDCAYPGSQSRCSETAVCLPCGIRRVIDLVRITGESIGGITTAYPHKSGLNQTLTLTTERAGDAVLLTVGR
jgi:hypothetical protein